MRPRLLIVTPVDTSCAEHLGATARSVTAAGRELEVIGVELVWSLCYDGNNPATPTPDVGGVELHERHLDGQWGPSVARNVALSATESDWVFPLDADDLCEPDGLAAVCAELADGWMWVASTRTELDGTPSEYQPGPRRVYTAGELNAEYRHPYRFHANNVAYHTRVLTGLGGWPAMPGGEDLTLLFRVAREHPGVSLPEVTINYRRWASQITASPTHNNNRALRYAMYNTFDLLGGRDPDQVRASADYHD